MHSSIYFYCFVILILHHFVLKCTKQIVCDSQTHHDIVYFYKTTINIFVQDIKMELYLGFQTIQYCMSWFFRCFQCLMFTRWWMVSRSPDVAKMCKYSVFLSLVHKGHLSFLCMMHLFILYTQVIIWYSLVMDMPVV